MEQWVLERLMAADDPVEWESPREVDWRMAADRVAQLRPELSRIAGRPFHLDNQVQDASFFADLVLRSSPPLSIGELEGSGRVIEVVFAVRFSNFGMLFTTWRNDGAEALPDEIAAELVSAVSAAGFDHVPEEAVHAPYTGRHPGFAQTTWWDRFFDYV